MTLTLYHIWVGVGTVDKQKRKEISVDLLNKYRSGEIESLSELFELHKGLAHKTAYKYSWVLAERRDIDEQDILQACRIGLWTAIEEWDPELWELGTIAIKHMHNEVRRMIWKQQRAKNAGYETNQISLEGLVDTERKSDLYDLIEDPKGIDPQVLVHQHDKCNDFFQNLQEKHQIPTKDLKALRGYVFENKQPKDGMLFSRIRSVIKNDRSTATRDFWRNWIDDNTCFFSSQSFVFYSAQRKSDISDPTSRAAIQREELEKRLSRILGGTIRGR